MKVVKITPKNHESEGIKKERAIQPQINGDNYYMKKWFMKDLPYATSWMVFSEEGEYNHMWFVDWVDRLKTDFHMKYSLFTTKLNIDLTGLAMIWLREPWRKGPLAREGWKEAMDSWTWNWDLVKQHVKSLWQRQVWTNSQQRTNPTVVRTKKKAWSSQSTSY